MKIKALLSFLLLFIGFGYGQTKSLLYQIESPNGKPSYLFGTMHIIPDSAFYFPGKVQKIIKHSDRIVLEIGDMNIAKAQRLLIIDSGSCFDIFTPEQKDSVIAWGATSMGMNPVTFEKAFSKSKPFVLMQLEAKDMLSGDVKYVEEEVKKAAPDLPLSGLETIEEQIGFFDAIPPKSMAEMILSTIRVTDEDDNPMNALIAAYQEKDLEKLAALINEEEATGFDTELLLTNRNKAWVPKIKTMIAKESCFIAVGAGHLGGEEGVIALLKKEGYTVTPIVY